MRTSCSKGTFPRCRQNHLEHKFGESLASTALLSQCHEVVPPPHPSQEP